MKKYIFTFLLLLLSTIQVFSQQTNGAGTYQYLFDDILIRQKVLEDPSIAGRYIFYEENLKQSIEAMNNNSLLKDFKTDTTIDGRRIIPVVFHIVHKGGAENISRAQIESAIELLNLDYNKLNNDTTAAYSWPAFSSRRADCQIEFRLAKIDPDGNCTDGIVRHYDPQTNYGYFKTMTDYCWLPSRYLNIFTVNFIYPEGMALPDGAFIGGMSPFPPSNPLSQALTGGDTLADGVLIRHDGIGNIGTAVSMGGMPINAQNRTFTHESGHYFNLYHPFNVGPICMLLGSDGCGSSMLGCGDEVSDTPPVQAATQNTTVNCYVPGSRNTCTNDNPDEPDMVENYMDYQWGFCTNIFTTGQLSRINATMQGDRRKLWSKENLIATGVLDTIPPQCPPIADFYSQAGFVCAGSSLQFTDYSYSGQATGWNWSFAGGTPSSSTDQNPVVTYNTPGTYSVTLVVSNANGSDSLTKQDLITVNSMSAGISTPFVEDFENTSLNNGWHIINDQGNTWALTSDSSAFSGIKSLWLNNFSNNAAGSTDEIISPAYDFTLLPTNGTPLLKFRLAYAGKITSTVLSTDTAYDVLKIFTSTDCGKSWSEKFSADGPDLATTNPSSSEFAPASQNDWLQINKVLPYSFLSNNHIMFKFVFKSNFGNNIYIDDINISSTILGNEENILNNIDFTVSPNPFGNTTNIDLNLPARMGTEIAIYDILGNKVCDLVDDYLSPGKHNFGLDRNKLGSSGIYILKASFNGNYIVRKIVLQ